MPRKNSRGAPGRPPLPDDERRKPWFSLRVTDEERAVIQQRADQRRMPVAVYVRRGAYRGWVRQTGVGAELIKIAAELEIQSRQLRDRAEDPVLHELADFLELQVLRIRAQIPHL